MKWIYVNKVKDKLIGFILPVILFIIWDVSTRLNLVPDTLVASPGQIGGIFVDGFRDGSLLFNLKITLGRVVAGFVAGTLAGFVVGCALGLSKTVDRYMGPLFHGLRQIPLFGWMPLLILWLGVGESFKLVLIAIGAFYPMVLNTYKGVKEVSPDLVEVARVFEYNKLKLVQKVTLPSALPAIFTGMRLGLSLSWMSVVGAEFIASNTGIGYMMAFARSLFQLDVVMVGLIMIGVCGLVMDYMLKLIEMRCLCWRNVFNAR